MSLLESQLSSSSPSFPPGWVMPEMPEWSEILFQPRRYKVPYGGRGSSKSWSIAYALLIQGTNKRLRILCAREFQRSIKDSVHKLLKDAIERLKLQGFYTVTDNAIIGRNGTEFLFVGLHANVTSVKSFEGIDICWVEEAETVTEDSWKTLIPTIRKDGSEIWISFNPREEDDPTAVRFITHGKELVDQGRAFIIKVNHDMNPFFASTELEAEMLHDYKVDPDAADWIWGGNFRKRSAAQILAGKTSIAEFEILFDSSGNPIPDKKTGLRWDGPWFGLDHGFATDPLSAHKYWALKNTLHVEYELYEPGIELNAINRRLRETLPGIERGYKVWADSARPETNSHLRSAGLNVEGCKKWKGSVEDGIAYLRSLDGIIIHPRCKGWIKEAQLYKWKTDKTTGVILPEPIDAWNHAVDDCRYALGPAIECREETLKHVHVEHVSIDPEMDQMEAGFASIW